MWRRNLYRHCLRADLFHSRMVKLTGLDLDGSVLNHIRVIVRGGVIKSAYAVSEVRDAQSRDQVLS